MEPRTAILLMVSVLVLNTVKAGAQTMAVAAATNKQGMDTIAHADCSHANVCYYHVAASTEGISQVVKIKFIPTTDMDDSSIIPGSLVTVSNNKTEELNWEDNPLGIYEPHLKNDTPAIKKVIK